MIEPRFTPADAMLINADQLITALQFRYIDDDEEARTPTVDAAGLTDVLTSLPEPTQGQYPTVAAQLASANADIALPVREQAIIESIDDCLKMIHTILDVQPEIAYELRRASPLVVRDLVADPTCPFSDEPGLLNVLDDLARLTLGWTADLGKAGERSLKKVQDTVAALKQSDDLGVLVKELRDFVDKDLSRIGKLEERLAASETGQLRSQQSRALAAAMVNRAMKGKQLSDAIIHLLQGPWFESAQFIILTQGVESEDWSRMQALTDTIIWTYQPIEGEEEHVNKEKQRLYRIIEHLPGEVRDLLKALEHDTAAAEAALDAIEEDHVSLVSGQTLEYVEFEPIAVEDDGGAMPTVSRLLMRKIANFEAGQWFHYQADDIDSRIKLLIKLDDVKQMLFTNRNGMKVMQQSFEEFAYCLSSNTARPITADNVFSQTFKAHYEGLMEEHTKQQRRIAERRAEMDRAAEEKAAARDKAAQEAAELARKKEEEAREAQAQARADRLEAAAKALDEADEETVNSVRDKVKALQTGAWLKLPGADGRLEECKLAVKMSASDKMIFVSQSGGKVGEYNSDELVRLLVAGQGEIQDEGVNYEDTLQQVVSKLRQDRHKSYDDLTGNQ